MVKHPLWGDKLEAADLGGALVGRDEIPPVLRNRVAASRGREPRGGRPPL